MYYSRFKKCSSFSKKRNTCINKLELSFNILERIFHFLFQQTHLLTVVILFCCRCKLKVVNCGMTAQEQQFLERAIELSHQGMQQQQGGPFGCVVVKDGVIVGEGCNQVTLTNDPTAHAEVVAIRAACKKLNSFQLTGCDIYTSCEPCPMCLGAIYWARPSRVIYANTKADAAAIDFDDQFIYDEIEKGDESRAIPFIHCPHKKALEVFAEWKTIENKKIY
jgi:tRNA(Arg) A34 adenosine deaminase TadA